MVYNRLCCGTTDDVRICATGDKNVSHKICRGCELSHVISVQRGSFFMDIVWNSFTGFYHCCSKSCNFYYPYHSDRFILFISCQNIPKCKGNR